MAKAVKALQAKEVNRIILTRPAVEAGERLGFLPGTLYEKIDPYLRPLYDALHDMLDPDSIPRLMAAGTIEVAPLAYMRGRTLNDSFIILDEAQNTSAEQMKMFLTRLGFGAKMVVTGDITQVDLAAGQASGLRLVQDILDGVEDIHFARLNSHDVVRHRLVSDIVNAYEAYDARTRARAGHPQRVAGGGRRDDRGTSQPDRAGHPRPPCPVIGGPAGEHRDRQRVRYRCGRGRAGRRWPGTCSTPCASTRWRNYPFCLSIRTPWPTCTSAGWVSPGRPMCWPSRWTSCGRPRPAATGLTGATSRAGCPG